MERMELRCEELRVPSVYARSSTVDRCRESSCEPRHEHCDNQSHTHRGWGDSSQETLPRILVMNMRGPALAVIRGITDMNGALAWRALITRYAPNTAPRVQSLMNAILNAKTFPSVLRTGRMAREHSQVGIDFWRPFQRVNEGSSLS